MPGPVVRPLRAVPPDPPVHRSSAGLVGRVVGDRYRLIAPIAEGQTSSVYKAEHVRMGKALCVKLLRGPLARDPDLAARFRTEARVVARLSHPHNIAVFDSGELEKGEGFYLAMEYLHGENLYDVLRREGRLSEARAAAIGEQLLGALSEAHEAGIVHRDVKPANVMLLQPKADADFVKLLDFGIAEIEGQGPGGGLGTPTYLSPEQARGAAPDARSDLYSLGVLLYELVAGRPPFVAENPMAVLSAHGLEEPAPLASLRPDVSPAFAAVVHRALAKQPQDRFATADAMREALRAAAGSGAAAPSAPGPTGAEAEPPAEVTGELEIASRADFPLVPPPRVRDPRKALVPGLVAVGLALAVLYAVGRLHGEAPTDVDEREPNDAPAASAPAGFAGWLELGRRNLLGEADAVRAATGGGDVDVYAVHPHMRGEAPDAILAIPAPGLALETAAWARRDGDGAGFAPLATGTPGEPVAARLPVVPTAIDPVVVRVRAASGEGRYRVMAVGPGAASGKAVLALLRELEAQGRPADALLVAAAFARLEPASPERDAILRVAARLAASGSRTRQGAGPGGPTP
ncbi:MAG TPA: protein kinase [Anaeromyxobacteraceae bacterium]|nr:protein kinase [Anaeromyxobacteraceae bacterium]